MPDTYTRGHISILEPYKQFTVSFCFYDTTITLGNGFSGVTEIQTGPDGLMYVLSLGGKISRKARPQYLNFHLQMDRLSVYFSCTLSVISLLAVFHLSNSSVLLNYAQNHKTT